MNLLKTSLSSAVIFAFAQQVSAAAPAQSNVTSLNLQTPEVYRCCDYDRDRFCEPYIRYAERQETEELKFSPEQILAAVTMQSVDPIYIGGARYALNKSKFTPVYRTRTIFDPCRHEEPIIINQLAGYEVSFPVDGDFGQQLYFDISGRSDRSMSLNVSCGSFSGSDSGDKFVVSKSQNTGGTCKSMTVKFSFPAGTAAPTYIDLNLMISEQL
ncbi:hypothetical protein ACFOEE_14470 [Pseudoalteromonas fenneropenaei]|uniref:Uncharacterized protein n=1 Tax=Pseudoalteromonas fenneropenaei TaxID=1737459 RepID=A0ABV7CMD6_9GAMM